MNAEKPLILLEIDNQFKIISNDKLQELLNLLDQSQS